MLEATLDLYTWHTPNGRKPAIMLAELGVPYTLHLVRLAHGDQKRSDYLELNPNGKIPTLVDRDPNLGRVVVFESCAILGYLGEKYRRFLPSMLGARRAEVLSWLSWQAAGPGPSLGQLGQLGRQRPLNDLAFDLVLKEARRLVLVLERRLEGREHIADEYSVADIACYPWFEAVAESFPAILHGTKNVRAWLHRVGSRPAVKLGMKLEQPGRKAA